MNTRYLQPSPAAGAALLARGMSGPVVMLNLLRFRETADYSQFPHLAPDSPITGEQAYTQYMKHAAPFVEARGGEVLFMGQGGAFLIGPSEEQWDRVLLVRQKSVADFLAFAADPAYLKGLGHRTAALEDSRLLPMEGIVPGI